MERIMLRSKVLVRDLVDYRLDKCTVVGVRLHILQASAARHRGHYRHHWSHRPE